LSGKKIIKDYFRRKTQKNQRSLERRTFRLPRLLLPSCPAVWPLPEEAPRDSGKCCFGNPEELRLQDCASQQND